VFGSTFVTGKEAKVSNTKVSYLCDCCFLEFFCLLDLPCLGEAFLKSLMHAPLGSKPFPCLLAKAAGFFGLDFLFCAGWFDFFNAYLSGVAGGCFFVDGVQFLLFCVAPQGMFFGVLSAVLSKR